MEHSKILLGYSCHMRACRSHLPNVLPTDGFVCVVNVHVVFVTITDELQSYLRFSKIWDKTLDKRHRQTAVFIELLCN